MYKKVLVPLDGSELAEKILPQVEDLAKCMQAEIVLLTVNVSHSMLLAEGTPTSATAENIAALKPATEKKLSQIANDLKAKGLKVSTLCRDGQPTLEIIKNAVDNGCDLIALATHGRGEVAWVIGSVAEKVVAHSPIPVLIMRVIKAHPLTAKK